MNELVKVEHNDYCERCHHCLGCNPHEPTKEDWTDEYNRLRALKLICTDCRYCIFRFGVS